MVMLIRTRFSSQVIAPGDGGGVFGVPTKDDAFLQCAGTVPYKAKVSNRSGRLPREKSLRHFRQLYAKSGQDLETPKGNLARVGADDCIMQRCLDPIGQSRSSIRSDLNDTWNNKKFSG